MDWNTISIDIKTSLSDAYFYGDADNERFDEWFKDRLFKIGLFDWKLEDFPTGIPNVNKLSGYVNSFEDNHKLYIHISVDDGIHSDDELADNDDLFNYIERKLVYRIIDELNEICKDLSIPMNNGSFNDLKFDDEEFYGLMYYSADYGYYISPRIKNSQFQIYPDFEVGI